MLKDTEERKKGKSDNTLEARRQKHTLLLTDFGVQESRKVTDHSRAGTGSQLCCRSQEGVRSGLQGWGVPPQFGFQNSLLGLCSQAGYQNILARLEKTKVLYIITAQPDQFPVTFVASEPAHWLDSVSDQFLYMYQQQNNTKYPRKGILKGTGKEQDTWSSLFSEMEM